MLDLPAARGAVLHGSSLGGLSASALTSVTRSRHEAPWVRRRRPQGQRRGARNADQDTKHGASTQSNQVSIRSMRCSLLLPLPCFALPSARAAPGHKENWAVSQPVRKEPRETGRGAAAGSRRHSWRKAYLAVFDQRLGLILGRHENKGVPSQSKEG